MIYFDDWLLMVDAGPVIARQYDNLTRRLEILGQFPEGWDWTLLVQADKHLDIIALAPMEGGMGVDLTAEMLALSGYYTVQLKGVQGELVRHTNQVRIFIPDSLSGDANWPEVPSEFSQIEANIRELGAHPPIPGDGGYWLVWDLEKKEYVTSDLPLPDVSVGPAGKAATIKVGETVTGDPDTPAKVENTGTENAAVLRFTIPRGAVGPTGATPAISVEVTGLPAGSEPTVEVSGTPEKPVISLGIPAGRQGAPGADGATGPEGPPGQAATVEIAETETVEPGTPAAMVELPESTPQARRYKAQVPQGIQGPAGAGVPPTDGVPEDYLLSVGGWAPPPDGGTGLGDLELVASATLEEAVDVISLDLSKPCTEVIAVLTPYGDADNPSGAVVAYLYLTSKTGGENGEGISFGALNLKNDGAMVWDFRAAHWRLEGNLIYKASYKETGVTPTGVMAPGSYPWEVQGNNWEITDIDAFRNLRVQLWNSVFGASTKLEVYGR